MIAAVALTVAFGACSSGSKPKSPASAASTTTTRPAAKSSVEVFGDSLAVQSLNALQAQGRAHGLAVSVAAYPGLAPCDLARSIRQAIVRGSGALVLAFTGNNLTPCMRRAGKPMVGAAYFAAYEAALDPLVAQAIARGIPVLLVGAPAFPADENTPDRVALNALYARMAAAHPGARYVPLVHDLSPDGFARAIPCIAGETAALGCRNRLITVRSGNGIHLDVARTVPCPTGHGSCSYSAGAHRYADAVIAALAAVHGLSYVPAPPTAGVPIATTGSG